MIARILAALLCALYGHRPLTTWVTWSTWPLHEGTTTVNCMRCGRKLW